jgi:flavin reductase (DIM6/NTAB) family NADH-FMN oxidoreductase RutF
VARRNIFVIIMKNSGDVMIEPQEYRDLMSGVCAPVTIVTTTVDGRPHGTTVSSLSALSLRPPLVSVAFDRSSVLLGQILTAGRFGVNVLGHAHDEEAAVFARRGGDRFAVGDWYTDHELPRLAGAVGWMVCDLDRTIEAGDHLLLFGLVRVAASRADIAPLVYAHRTFGTHSRFAERPRPAIADLIAACAS